MATAENEEGTEEEVIDTAEQEEGEKPESEAKEKPEGEQSQNGDDGEVHVGFGDESPPSEQEQAPEWVRDLRRKHAETNRRNRELEAENQRLKQPAKAELGEKPTLANCDYDEERFESELTAWQGRKAEFEAEQQKQAKAAEQQQKAWNTKLEGFAQQKAALKVSDYDVAEEEVTTALNQQQVAIIIQAAKNSGHLIYAIGKSEPELKRLQAISDPIEFAAAIGALETKLKVTSRTEAPPPDSSVRGGAQGGSKAADAHLAKLEAEANRTGNRTKLIAYKREQEQRQRAK